MTTIPPIKKFSTTIAEHSLDWYADMLLSAHEMASDGDKAFPFFVTVSLDAWRRDNIFLMRTEITWMAEVFIFANNDQMRKYIEEIGEEFVIDWHYLS